MTIDSHAPKGVPSDSLADGKSATGLHFTLELIVPITALIDMSLLKCSSASLMVQVIYILILENYGILSKSPAFFALDFNVLWDYWCKQVNHSQNKSRLGVSFF